MSFPYNNTKWPYILLLKGGWPYILFFQDTLSFLGPKNVLWDRIYESSESARNSAFAFYSRRVIFFWKPKYGQIYVGSKSKFTAQYCAHVGETVAESFHQTCPTEKKKKVLALVLTSNMHCVSKDTCCLPMLKPHLPANMFNIHSPSVKTERKKNHLEFVCNKTCETHFVFKAFKYV